MSGKRLLSILLICSMLAAQPAVEVYAEEGTENVRIDVETEMTAEAMLEAETETPPLGEDKTENGEAEESVAEEPLEETEQTDEMENAPEGGNAEMLPEAAPEDGGNVEMLPETALTEEVEEAEAAEDTVPEVEEDGMPTAEPLAAEDGLSGTYGENLTWTLVDGTLTISGTGEMEDSDYTCSPWYDNCGKINKIIVQNGVTSIGRYVFSGCSSLTSITIPDSVTGIGAYAFCDCSSLTSITIPDSVTSIGENAFSGCSSLASIMIPSSVTSIDSGAFSGCSNLTSITIPNGVTSIGHSAFSYCSSLTSITIPSSVTGIGAYAFSGCSSLTSITISDNVTGIGAYAFSYCNSLTSITIPDSVTDIGAYAFYDCSSLTSITIPNGVTSIDESAFSGCNNLTSITIPDSVTSIGENAFSYCNSLTSITIPDSVTSIGYSAFSYCSSLTSITLPDSVAGIGVYTFYDCRSLISITIPRSVINIGWSAFYGCRLTDVYYGGSEDEWNAIDVHSDNGGLFSANIHYNTPNGSAGDQGGHLGWSIDINGVLTVSGMGNMADYHDPDSPAPWSGRRDEIKKVIITQFVTSIGSSAFAGCTNLTTTTIPMGLKSIGDSAFSGCENLERVDYMGSSLQWSFVKKGTDNAPLYNAKIVCRNLTTDIDRTDMSIQQKQVSYYDTIHGVSNTLDINWGFSKMTSSGYDHEAAIAGLVLSGATESSKEHAEQAMKDLGFTSEDPRSRFYDKEWYEIAQPAVTFGYKHVVYGENSDEHFFAVAVRGTTDAADVLTDAASLVGSFQVGAEFVCTELESYMIECSGMSLEELREKRNVQFFITGHSLGGAVANITAKKMIERYGAKSVVAYTFAASPCATVFDVIFAGDNYDIYNIINNEDIVPKASWLINGLVFRNGTDKPFHRDDDPDIYTRFHTLTGTKDLKELMTGWKIWDSVQTRADKTLTRKLCAHSPSVYMAYLANSVTSRYNGKRIVVRCPVDVEVYAADGEDEFLVCRITDNKIDDTVPAGVYAYVDGDEKYIELIYDGDYRVKLTATDSGTMTYTVQSVDIGTNQVVEEKVYSNVALAKDKEMTSSVSVWDKADLTIDTTDKVDTEDVRLFVVNGSGEPEKEVLPDGKGTEVPVDSGSDEDTPKGVLPGDIPADGKIPDGLWIAKVPDVAYTGKAVKPEVHIYDATTRLVEKKDYTISYKNNVNAYVTAKGTAADGKAPTVTVTGKGNYSGKETAVFTILPVTLDSGSADVLDITLAAGNKVQKPVPVITVNGRKLANKKDFTLAYPDQSVGAYQAAGTYGIKVTGKGNYQGELIIPMTITDKKLVSRAVAAKIEAQTYTGNPLTPKPVVTYGRDTLTEGTGYELEYRNNTEIGTATILVKGIGDYCGQKRVTFPITGGSVSKAKLSDSFKKQMEYTGSPVTQSCTLTAVFGPRTVTLDAGKDYTVRYSNNTKAGKATVVYTGKGAFTGTLKKTYTITPYDIGADSQEKIKYDSNIISAYAKGGSCPVPTITFGGKVLKAGTDFTLSYKNNKAVSSVGAQIIVKGKGNYKGSITIPFQVTAQDLSNLTLSAADLVYQAGKADIYKTALKLTDVDGKVLSAGKDYNKETIEYTYVNAVGLEGGEHREAGDKVASADVVPAGTELKVTVYAKEGSNYTGSIAAFYRVAKADLSKAKVTVNPQIYTGRQIKPGKNEIKVEMGRTALSADDYDIVSYGTNTEKGTGTLTIRGKGSYGGTKTVPFKIKTKGFLWWGK